MFNTPALDDVSFKHFLTASVIIQLMLVIESQPL